MRAFLPQAVVERRLFELEGKTRHDIGREKLVERIWAWKDEYQKRIVSQQQAMAASCDWDRQRFTMDRICSRAVRTTFFKMFSDDLIFRGDRLINWDCKLQTAVADDEIYYEKSKGHFYYVKYKVVAPKSGEPTHITIAHNPAPKQCLATPQSPCTQNRKRRYLQRSRS